MPINNITIQGRLGVDATTAGGANGTLFTNLFIVFPRRRKNASGEWADETGVINGVIFGERGDKLAPLLKKGTPVVVAGKLGYAEWKDKTTGESRSKNEILIDEIYIGAKRENRDADSGLAEKEFEF